jgi:hypothetical protein
LSGPKYIQSSNKDIDSGAVALVIVHIFQERLRHFVQHEPSHQCAQYPKRLHCLLAAKPRAFERPQREASEQLTLAAPFR